MDLEAVRPLNEVRVFNRMDSVRDRSQTLRVLLSDDGATWRIVHDQAGHTFGGADGRPVRVLLGGERARYVRLQLAERTYLHLDKVFVLEAMYQAIPGPAQSAKPVRATVDALCGDSN